MNVESINTKIYKSSLVLFFFFVYFSNSQIKNNNNNNVPKANKINEAIKTAEDYHLNNIDKELLIEAAINGMLKALDPHSYYMNKDNLKEIDEKRVGASINVGLNYVIIDDTVNVINAVKDSPAQVSGLKTGDKILKVDGKSIIGTDRKKFDDLCRGEKGSSIAFDVKRPNQKDLLVFNMKRAKIPIYSVDAAFAVKGTDIGYISINRFMATTYIEMLDSLSILTQKGVKRLIMDLRNNPGGSLDEAYMVADEFIEDNKDIVITKGRRKEFDEHYKSTPGGKYENNPLIVLIDGSSASASEVVAGAVQDLDRALVIGEPSFGKGLVQKPYMLSDGTEIWLTVANYYTPSGRNIQKTYKDNVKYGTLADRINVEEGFNIRHNLEIVEYTADSVPIYRTTSGRPVLGAGGITPDYVIKNDSLTEMGKEIRNHNVILKYAINQISSNAEMYSKYVKNFDSFLVKFEMDSNFISNFKQFVENSNITWKDDEFKTDEEYLKNNIKASIAGIIWGNNERQEILFTSSKYYKKSIEMFKHAEKIFKLN